MIIARVVGHVVASQKQASHEGKKLLLLQPLDLDGNPLGDVIVAVDAASAGVGDRVLAVQEGFSAMTAVGHIESPIDAAVIGVVDHVDLCVIAHLTGKLADKETSRVVIDVNGVGYEVFVPLTTFSVLPDRGGDVSIDIYTHVREDIIALYGFATRGERAIFEKLITISGIGPRLAITILSGGSVEDLVTAIKRSDLARLTAIAGVGKKTAERIVVELKDKLQEFAVIMSEKGAVDTDVLSALENLGYNRVLVESAMRRAREGDQEVSFDALFKRSLQILTKG